MPNIPEEIRVVINEEALGTFEPEKGAVFLSDLLDQVITYYFSSNERPSDNVVDRILAVNEQAKVLERLREAVRDIEAKSIAHGLLEEVFFHDVNKIITAVQGFASTITEFLNTPGMFGLEGPMKENPAAITEYQDMFLEFEEYIHNGVIRLAKMLKGFNLKEGEVVITPDQLAEFRNEINNLTITVRKNSPGWTDLERLQHAAPLSPQEKQRHILEGTLATAQLERLRNLCPQVEHFEYSAMKLDESDLEQIKVWLNVATLVRIFDNVLPNTTEEYEQMLIDSNYQLDIDPVFRVITDYQEKGVFIIFEDEGPGFKGAEQAVVTGLYNNDPCWEYFPEVGKTRGKVGSKGVGLAGLASAIQEVEGSSYRCFTLLEPIPENDPSYDHSPNAHNFRVKGSRTEIFVPTFHVNS